MKTTGRNRLIAAMILALAPLVLGIAVSAQKPDPDSQKLVKLVDGVMQERFQLDNGVFGTNRIVRVVAGHPDANWFWKLSKTQQAAIHAANDMHVDYLVGFLSIKHVAGTPPSGLKKSGSEAGSSQPWACPLPIQPKRVKTFTPNQEFNEVSPTVVKLLPQLKAGKSMDLQTKGRLIAMRPIPAKQQSCINCHSGARLGDTLGVMVYIVDENKGVARL